MRNGVTTLAQVMAKGAGAGDDRLTIDDMIGAVNQQHPGGKIVVTDDDVASYIREHPLETLGKPRAKIEQLICDAWKPAIEALVKASHQEGARASDARVHDGQLRKADALMARADSPEGAVIQARLDRAFARGEALKYRTPRTAEERREHTDLAKEVSWCQTWLAHAPGFK